MAEGCPLPGEVTEGDSGVPKGDVDVPEVTVTPWASGITITVTVAPADEDIEDIWDIGDTEDVGDIGDTAEDIGGADVGRGDVPVPRDRDIPTLKGFGDGDGIDVTALKEIGRASCRERV